MGITDWGRPVPLGVLSTLVSPELWYSPVNSELQQKRKDSGLQDAGVQRSTARVAGPASVDVGSPRRR